MIAIPGYEITQKIQSSVKTVIYRGQRRQDRHSVIIKVLNTETPNLEEITRLKHEYEILKNVEIPGLVKAEGLAAYQNGFALILEDFSGEALKKWMGQEKLEISTFLTIAIQLAEILGNLHQQAIVHKDIKPQNIIINPENGTVKIIDFSIASRLSVTHQPVSNPNLLEGTLAYMSPEQTGRMNRGIDYRSDFYSLGVTFYEMLAGVLPFQATDPMALVHSHIAKQPRPLQEFNPEIPQVVSDIVMKLLAKTAEERYQSAYGLKADLETCLLQLKQTGKIEKFVPGQLDKSGQFIIAEKLYGREAEVAQLMATFERVAAGSSEMMLVAGYSGIGKSALVHEVHKPIVEARGYFIGGKFDQFKRNIPYACLIQAFQDLIRQLLTESDRQINLWKQKLLEALGANGQIIIDVIPEVELIIGKQSPVPPLGPSETQNRFNRVFQQFIHVFTTPEHPLVAFLDDLQWADTASLKLIQLLITDPDSQYLLLIGAYRDNEVSPTHPLMGTLEEIQKAGAVVNTIALKPLERCHVSQSIADTLKTADTAIDLASSNRTHLVLAELLYNKTQGNPFFLTQMLKTLYQEKLIEFNFSKKVWQWDIDRIQSCGIRDYNVVELVARNIQKLPEKTQEVLKLAACIGNLFNLEVLALASSQSPSAIAAHLWPALQAGLILPLSEAYKIPLVFAEEEGKIRDLKVHYKFLHDRVQQAAYSLIPEADKQETHFTIGKLLLEQTPEEQRKDNIFALVNPLNYGIDLLNSQAEKDELAILNLIAGQKAKAATAYEPALNYLNLGLKLLGPKSWETQYDLTLSLYVETAETSYLNANLERAKQLSETAIQRAHQIWDKLKAYEIKIQLHVAENKLKESLDTILETLKVLGFYLPTRSPEIKRCTLQLKQDINAIAQSISELAELPEMTDRPLLAALRILMNAAPIYLAKPSLLPLTILTMVKLCTTHGNSPVAAYAYGYYAILLCGDKDIDSGYKYGALSVKVLDKFHAPEIQAKVNHLFNFFVKPYKESFRKTVEPLRDNIQIGLETGDLEYGFYSAIHHGNILLFIGEPLDAVNEQQGKYLEMMEKLKLEFHSYCVKIWKQLTLNLLNRSADPGQLVGESLDESIMLPIWIKENQHYFVFIASLAKLMIQYWFKQYEKGVKTASLVEKDEKGSTGILYESAYNFYYSLTLLADLDGVEASEKQRRLKKVAANQKQMKEWAKHAPANFQHKYELVEAEKARIGGKDAEAIALYDRSIQHAEEQGYIPEQALANERAAEFHFARGSEKIAQFYLKEAYYGYIRWGAVAKVQDLEKRYPQLLYRITSETTPNIEDVLTTIGTTTGANSSVLDLATVMKISQALASEIVLENLLDTLMKIAIENIGAERGFLILQKKGKLSIAATAEVNEPQVEIDNPIPIASSDKVPRSAIEYVARTRETIVLNNASEEGIFTRDRYIIQNRPKSLLCTPLIHKGKLIGILYLENNLTTGAFTAERLEVLQLLSSQVAISLENASLYANLETAKLRVEEYNRNLEVKVQERTLELQTQNKRLNQTLIKLQQTQNQLIQTEKMSSLGQLVAGVAHEINNPVNFIYGNIIHTEEYIQDLLDIFQTYQEEYPHPSPRIANTIAEKELDFLLADLPKMLSSMKVGADRIREIVLSLRNFSRLDESEMKPVDIHDGIESTLLILQHRLKETAKHSEIAIVREYEALPLVECYAGQLNQVFMNLLSNAIDAIQEKSGVRSQKSEEPKHSSTLSLLNFSSSPTIRIRTHILDNERVQIRIADNGPGMSEQVQQRMFDPFFTTKPVGSGTGLGLSISYSVVVEKHQGELSCVSSPGQGTEFLIEIPIYQNYQKSCSTFPDRE